MVTILCKYRILPNEFNMYHVILNINKLVFRILSRNDGGEATEENVIEIWAQTFKVVKH